MVKNIKHHTLFQTSLSVYIAHYENFDINATIEWESIKNVSAIISLLTTNLPFFFLQRL